MYLLYKISRFVHKIRLPDAFVHKILRLSDVFIHKIGLPDVFTIKMPFLVAK